MFIQVQPLHETLNPLWYQTPAQIQEPLVGSIVRIPLQKRIILGIVVGRSAQRPAGSFTIRQALRQEVLPADQQYAPFLQALSHYYQIPTHFGLQRIQHFLTAKDIANEPAPSLTVPTTKAIALTDEQDYICQSLYPHIEQPAFTPTLIHGVTGSGKTEVYKALMTYALQHNKTVLFLVPEVTLAVAFEMRLKAELPAYAAAIYGFHSATNKSAKQNVWHLLLRQDPCIIIGVHLPTLLPIANLGLIIVDEEHDIGYQEKKHPKINSKEAALLRAHIAGIPIVLGSATPSLSSWHNVQQKKWRFFQLLKRFSGAFPTVRLVHLPSEKKRAHTWLSNELYKALQDRLAKKEQSIIFLNRRGFCFFLQCKSCQTIVQCDQCSVSLTVHMPNILRCHYCGFEALQPTHCAQCQTTDWLKKGIGTQQIVTILQELLPHARIARADLDSTVNRKRWQQTLTAFEQGDIDILVGTQTITKGYHFPHVTLVGVIWADVNLHMPFFNASETTLHQLVQVAGRAGRQHKNSLVILQTMVEHPIFSYLNEHHYTEFYAYEMERRALLQYPPAARLVEIELKNNKEPILIQEAAQVAQQLQAIIKEHKLNITLLGPAAPLVSKIQNTHSRKIYLKGAHVAEIAYAYSYLDTQRYKSALFFTPNPLQ